MWVIVTYNRLVRLRLLSRNAWADIDVQLKRRYDLIPNLVETVKGYAGHERQTFREVVEARNRAMAARGPGQKARAEAALGESLKSLFALAESYPELRAAESFRQLHDSLEKIEEAIQNARRYYNAVVRDLNTRIEVFPDNLVARPLGFKQAEFFRIGSGESQAPQVQFPSGQ
ncbi:MAG TPA: LemA family protein [Acidobacteriota bacterium]|nr:LemA family protein [Acidobacteriota bacterium]